MKRPASDQHEVRRPISETVLVRVYRTLLGLYPRSLRRDVGDEMERLFEDLHREASSRGFWQGLWFGVRACAELPARAFLSRHASSPHGAHSMRGLVCDLRFAWLAAVRQRRHTAVVVITIAVGIGAATAVFSITDAAILRPLPFPEGDRLVVLAQKHPSGWTIYGQDAAAFQAWSEQPQLFDQLGGINEQIVVTEIAGEPREIHAAAASAQLLQMLEAQPAFGRLLGAQDAAEGAAPVVLMSERLWRQQFADDDEIVAQRITLDGVEHAVVGVLPNAFAYPRARTDLWLPYDPLRGKPSSALARLAPGLSVEAAQEQADAIALGLAEAFPRDAGWKLALIPLEAQRTGGATRTAMWIALAAAGLLLLVAVVNVAQVALARAAQREGELAVRAALGAGRARIMRQVVMESLLLCLGGGLLGVAFAHVLVGWTTRAAPDLVQISAIQIGVDWRAFAVALALSIAAGAGAGALPAWSASRAAVTAGLRSNKVGLSHSGRRRRLQAVLIATEAMLCLVLLAGAGLLLNSFERLTSVEPGFDAEPLVSVILNLDEDRYPDPAARLTFLEEVASRLARLPGVDRATAAAGGAPLPGGVLIPDDVESEDGKHLPPGSALVYGGVSQDYFSAAGIPLTSGRGLGPADYDQTNAVISETLARALFDQQVAVGRRFRIDEEGEWWTVVGVAAQVAVYSLSGGGDELQVYMPLKGEDTPRAYSGVIVRATGDPAALIPTLQEAIWEVDPLQPISRFELGADTVAGWVARDRLNVLIFGTFAVVALVLVVVGVAGVVGQAVVARSREIGIRVALGASGRSVLALATLGALKPIILGLALGSIAVWQTTHLLASLLYGVEPNDLPTLVAVAIVFLVTTLVAAYIPARRVLKVDPVRALRAE